MITRLIHYGASCAGFLWLTAAWCEPAIDAQALAGTWECMLNEKSHGIAASTQGPVTFAPTGQLRGSGTLNMSQSDTNASLEYTLRGSGDWALLDHKLSIHVTNWTYSPANMLSSLVPDAPRALLPQDMSADFSIDNLSAHNLVGIVQPDGIIVRCTRP